VKLFSRRTEFDSGFEKRVWRTLWPFFLLGIKRQVRVRRYRMDFVIGNSCVVEADGYYTHHTPEGIEKDEKRDRIVLSTRGWPTVRITESGLKDTLSVWLKVFLGVTAGKIIRILMPFFRGYA